MSPRSIRSSVQWLACIALITACADSATSPVRRVAQPLANVEVGVTAGDLVVHPRYEGQAVESMLLTACAWTARARHLATNSISTQFHFCDLPPFVNLAVGEHEVQLSFGASHIRMAPPQTVTVTAGAVNEVVVETSAESGLLSGTLMVNGGPGSDMTVCAVTGGTMPSASSLQQCGVLQSAANGAFRFLVPSGAGRIEVRTPSFQLLHSMEYSATPGTTTDVGVISVSVGDLQVRAQYNGQDLSTMGLTMCAWTARARHVTTNAVSTQFHFCVLPAFTNLAVGEYEVKLTFGASAILMAPAQAATVQEGADTDVVIETSAGAGLITGTATMNGQLASNVTICARMGDASPSPGSLQQCGTITSTQNGRFSFLVPPGSGIIEVRDMSFNLLDSRAFTASAGTETSIGTVSVSVGDLAVKPTYEGVALQDLQLTACAWTARARNTSTGAISTQFHFCALPPFRNIQAGDYEATVTFGASQVLMAAPAAATVTGGGFTNLQIETSERSGLLSGTVTLNGQPGTNLQICVVTGGSPNMPSPTTVHQCGSVQNAHNGRFRFLVPEECGTGTVRGQSFNLLASFDFCVEAGEETNVGNPVEPSDQTPPVIVPTVTGTLGNDGWYTSDVSITWSVTDGESAISSDPCAPVSVTADDAGTTYSCSATSAGGTTSESVTVKRDAANPVITFGGNLGTYTVDQVVAITCSATDAMSGIADSSCPGASGDAYTFGVGTHTLVASAADAGGNSASASATFTIHVTTESLCALVERFTTNRGVANALCAKLRNDSPHAFRNHVRAQSGKFVPADRAALLIALSEHL